MSKIVFVIESLQLGGAEKSLINLLQNFNYKAHDVDLILFQSQSFLLNQVPKEVRIIQKQLPRLSIFSRVQFYVARKLNKNKFHTAQLFWTFIKNKLLENNVEYDVAIAYNQGFSTYYVSSFISARKKVAWLNTDYKKAGYNIDFDYPFYKQFNNIIAVSPSAKKSLELELKRIFQKVDIQIIKDIVDKEHILILAKDIQEVPFVNGKINIVTVARLVKLKGLDLAIASCKRLVDKKYDINWYILGDGLERKKLETLIKKNGLRNFFFLLGSVENPYPYIANCDIYVQTSLFEGMGLSLIEASYLNKPIVSTNFESIAYTLENDQTGLIANMNDMSIFSNIERLILDQNLRQEFTRNLQLTQNNDKQESLQKISKLLN